MVYKVVSKVKINFGINLLLCISCFQGGIFQVSGDTLLLKINRLDNRNPHPDVAGLPRKGEESYLFMFWNSQKKSGLINEICKPKYHYEFWRNSVSPKPWLMPESGFGLGFLLQ
jgi:hypothetical protein